MIAETAFNVVEVLSPEERKRLLEMLKVTEQPSIKIKTKPSIISDTECREIIINHFKRFSKRFKEKNHNIILK
jgi:DNA-directed RNA polymerase subunit H (RpoH/RPB5)